jgi:hypothetical protein
LGLLFVARPTGGPPFAVQIAEFPWILASRLKLFLQFFRTQTALDAIQGGAPFSGNGSRSAGFQRIAAIGSKAQRAAPRR